MAIFKQTDVQNKDESKYKWQLVWDKSKSKQKTSAFSSVSKTRHESYSPTGKSSGLRMLCFTDSM